MRRCFNDILTGKIAGNGVALDEVLVQNEQARVQAFINQTYPNGVPPGLSLAAMTAFWGGPAAGLLNFPPLPLQIQNAMGQVQAAHGLDAFDFFNQAQRTELGINEVHI